MPNSRIPATLLTAALTLFLVNASFAHEASRPVRQITGVLDVLQADDFAHGRHYVFYTIEDLVSGRAYKIRFEKVPPGKLVSGNIISARAVQKGDELVVTAELSSSVQTLDLAASVAAEERRAAVLIVNFSDKAVSTSKTDVGRKVFTDPMVSPPNKSVDGMYREASFGQVGFPGDTNGDGALDVFGPFTIPYTSTSACDYYAWGYAAEDKAVASGIDLSIYQHIVYVMPSNSCGWAGISNVGCATVCRAWIFQSSYGDIYAHEMGHNLSLKHAGTDTNNDGVKESDYGDYSDVMGYSGVGWRQVNAPHKDQMGWFGPFPGQVQKITTGGTYRIAPLETSPDLAISPQILKIKKGNTNEYYYLSYRILSGYDATLRTQYANGCTIHR
ncbi:MAG: hypothetical protein HY706_10720, partial [Candidatus Hydrogenedentes bacterium]|nr:hypothetical protein [Candidatus Hydrogenedentota bacterium]